jgi:hypothetical protein
MSAADHRKKYRISHLQTLELVSRDKELDIFDLKEKIVNRNYEHLKKYLLKRVRGKFGYEYKAEELDYPDKVWLEPCIQDAREVGCNRIADFLTKRLQGLEEFHRYVEEAKKELGELNSLQQAAESMINLGRLEEADELIKEFNVKLEEGKKRNGFED